MNRNELAAQFELKLQLQLKRWGTVAMVNISCGLPIASGLARGAKKVNCLPICILKVVSNMTLCVLVCVSVCICVNAKSSCGLTF